MEEINLYSYSFNNNPLNGPVAQLTFDNHTFVDGHICLTGVSLALGRNSNISEISNVFLLDAKIYLNSSQTMKSIGEVVINPLIFNPKYNRSNRVPWILDSSDIATIEKFRSNGNACFHLNISGLVEVKRDNEIIIVPIRGEHYITIQQSSWNDYIEKLGYSTVYTLNVPSVIASDSSWQEATHKLGQARSLLRTGYTHSALEKCLSILDAYVDPHTRGGSYDEKLWNGILQGISDQKQLGLKKLFAGLSTYLNKVGHHRNSAEKDAEGLLPLVQIDHYEAELMVSVTQMIVTYIERINSMNKTRSE